MNHTVDSLMALAERMAVAMAGKPDACELIDARSELRTALTEALGFRPVQEPLPGACKTCGNEYLASRTDVYKDKRPFIYCDCCGAMADSKTWYLTHGTKETL
jgi:hypothetical protein